MPKYRAEVKLWLGHENRMVQEGEEFETVFPKVKAKDGTETEMRLGDNLTLLDEPKEEAPKKRTAAADKPE